MVNFRCGFFFLDTLRMEGRRVPAITQLIAHILQVRISHIVHREDEAVLVLVEAFPDVREKLFGELLAFLVDFGEVDDFRPLGFGHCCRPWFVAGKSRGSEDIIENYFLIADRINPLPRPAWC